MEQTPEIFLRRLLLFWWFCGTFAGKSPAFVVVLVVLWNICRRISGFCSYIDVILEHLPEIAGNCRKLYKVKNYIKVILLYFLITSWLLKIIGY